MIGPKIKWPRVMIEECRCQWGSCGAQAMIIYGPPIDQPDGNWLPLCRQHRAEFERIRRKEDGPQ